MKTISPWTVVWVLAGLGLGMGLGWGDARGQAGPRELKYVVDPSDFGGLSFTHTANNLDPADSVSKHFAKFGQATGSGTQPLESTLDLLKASTYNNVGEIKYKMFKTGVDKPIQSTTVTFQHPQGGVLASFDASTRTAEGYEVTIRCIRPAEGLNTGSETGVDACTGKINFGNLIAEGPLDGRTVSALRKSKMTEIQIKSEILKQIFTREFEMTGVWKKRVAQKAGTPGGSKNEEEKFEPKGQSFDQFYSNALARRSTQPASNSKTEGGRAGRAK